jgi:TonB family protein
MNRKKQKTILVFIGLSLLVHFSVVVSLYIVDHTQPPPQERVEIEYVEPELTPPPPPPERAREKVQKEAQAKQIIEQQKQLNNEEDPDSKYLSAFSQKVVRQTRAEHSGKFNNEAKGGKRGSKSDSKEKQKKTAASERGELPDLKDLSPKFEMAETQGDEQQNDDPSKSPGKASQTDDYIKDVQNGLQTLLSTREFIYYSYYNRIKEALRQHWEPTVREKVKIIYRQGRNIASAKDRVTQVLVTLDANGELIKVEVLTQSGVMDLDNAAVEAFRNAAPFPNPPKGMVESDGTIKIRWDFVLEA